MAIENGRVVPGKAGAWFRSGDVAEVDAEGYVYIVDRKKDLIIRGGENISCAEARIYSGSLTAVVTSLSPQVGGGFGLLTIDAHACC